MICKVHDVRLRQKSILKAVQIETSVVRTKVNAYECEVQDCQISYC